MATGLRDDIKTMRGRRQEAGLGAKRLPWSMDLSSCLPSEAWIRGGEVGTEEDREGREAEKLLGLHRCANSGNYLSSKRRSFPLLGSNWGCQTVHLHGNDYFYFVAKLSWRPWVCAKRRGAAGRHVWRLLNIKNKIKKKAQIPYQNRCS